MQEILISSVGRRVQNANLASTYAKLFWAPTWYQILGDPSCVCRYSYNIFPINKEFLGTDHRKEAILRLETSSKSHDDDDNSEILNGPLEEERSHTMVSHHSKRGRPWQDQGKLTKVACSWPIFRTCS